MFLKFTEIKEYVHKKANLIDSAFVKYSDNFLFTLTINNRKMRMQPTSRGVQTTHSLTCFFNLPLITILLRQFKLYLLSAGAKEKFSEYTQETGASTRNTTVIKRRLDQRLIETSRRG